MTLYLVGPLIDTIHTPPPTWHKVILTYFWEEKGSDPIDLPGLIRTVGSHMCIKTISREPGPRTYQKSERRDVTPLPRPHEEVDT